MSADSEPLGRDDIAAAIAAREHARQPSRGVRIADVTACLLLIAVQVGGGSACVHELHGHTDEHRQLRLPDVRRRKVDQLRHVDRARIDGTGRSVLRYWTHPVGAQQNRILAAADRRPRAGNHTVGRLEDCRAGRAYQRISRPRHVPTHSGIAITRHWRVVGSIGSVYLGGQREKRPLSRSSTRLPSLTVSATQRPLTEQPDTRRAVTEER